MDVWTRGAQTQARLDEQAARPQHACLRREPKAQRLLFLFPTPEDLPGGTPRQPDLLYHAAQAMVLHLDHTLQVADPLLQGENLLLEIQAPAGESRSTPGSTPRDP